MRTQIKFHAIAIIAITLIVVVAYSLKGTSSSQDFRATGEGIAIASATWGSNCNTAITQALEARKHSPISKDAEQLMPAITDNALPALRKRCDNQTRCSLGINSDTLGLDPMPSCFKRLNIRYRCFTFDHLTTIDIGQGEMLTIDCNQPQATDASGKNNAQ